MKQKVQPFALTMKKQRICRFEVKNKNCNWSKSNEEIEVINKENHKKNRKNKKYEKEFQHYAKSFEKFISEVFAKTYFN